LAKEAMVVTFTSGGADTDRVAPFLFKAIRSESAIPENPAALQRLKNTLLNVSKPISEERSRSAPRFALQLSKRRYALSDNPWNLRSIVFDFAGSSDTAMVTLEFPEGEWVISAGLDGSRRFSRFGPEGLRAASVGRWLSDSEFLLDLDTVAGVNHFLVRAEFSDGQVQLVLNEASGELRDVVIRGSASSK
jgi:hypothetical protein